MTKVILARFSTRRVLNNDSICARNTTFYKYPRQFALVVKQRELLQYKTDEKMGRSLNYILSSIFRDIDVKFLNRKCASQNNPNGKT